MLPHIEGTEVHFIKIAARRFSGFKTYTIDSRTAAITDLRPVLDQMIQRVVDGFRFLEDLTDLGRNLAGDDGRRRRADAEALRDEVKGTVGAHLPRPRWRFPASTFRPGSAS